MNISHEDSFSPDVFLAWNQDGDGQPARGNGNYGLCRTGWEFLSSSAYFQTLKPSAMDNNDCIIHLIKCKRYMIASALLRTVWMPHRKAWYNVFWGGYIGKALSIRFQFEHLTCKKCIPFSLLKCSTPPKARLPLFSDTIVSPSVWGGWGGGRKLVITHICWRLSSCFVLQRLSMTH